MAHCPDTVTYHVSCECPNFNPLQVFSFSVFILMVFVDRIEWCVESTDIILMISHMECASLFYIGYSCSFSVITKNRSMNDLEYDKKYNVSNKR